MLGQKAHQFRLVSGVSYRTRLDKLRTGLSDIGSLYRKTAPVRVILNRDLRLVVLDKNGQRLSGQEESAVRTDRVRDILAFLHQETNQKNRILNLLPALHLDTLVSTPTVNTLNSSVPVFPKPKPAEPVSTAFSLQEQLMFWSESENKRQYQPQRNDYTMSLKNWEDEKQRFDSAMLHLWPNCGKDKAATEELLKIVLRNIDWPLPVKIGFFLSKNMDAVWLSMKLPDSNDLPQHEYSVVTEEQKLARTLIKDDNRRQLYTQFVHAAGFRLLGQIFAIVPVPWVILSVYSGISSVASLNSDECTYSVQVKRGEWESVRLSSNGAVDLPVAMNSSQLR